MNYKTMLVALSLCATAFAFVPAAEAYWYCDGNDANDPNPLGVNGAPAVANRNPHTFALLSSVFVVQDGVQTGAGGVVAFSADDATNGACTQREVALTDGDGENERGVNGGSFTSTSSCDGYGNKHHGAPSAATASNVPATLGQLAYDTGVDGPVHEPDNPATPADERLNVPDPCVGNDVVSNDPTTDAWDCTSTVGFNGGATSAPTPVEYGTCNSVSATQPVFLYTGPVVTGGPVLECCAHSAYVLAWAAGGAVDPLHVACVGVNGAYTPVGSLNGATLPGSPDWHSQCAAYVGVTLALPSLTFVSTPVQGVVSA